MSIFLSLCACLSSSYVTTSKTVNRQPHSNREPNVSQGQHAVLSFNARICCPLINSSTVLPCKWRILSSVMSSVPGGSEVKCKPSITSSGKASRHVAVMSAGRAAALQCCSPWTGCQNPYEDLSSLWQQSPHRGHWTRKASCNLLPDLTLHLTQSGRTTVCSSWGSCSLLARDIQLNMMLRKVFQ